ncbi:MAG: DUF916 domain-containing protein [Nanoarchaeota archaeon]|nr:DUF916 domain-containing protein [Nanoarchaeota archaeon]
MRIKNMMSIIVFLVLISSAYAVGVVPSYIDVSYISGSQDTYDIKITNNEAEAKIIELSPDITYSQYFEISENRFELAAGESKIISFKFRMPEEMERPGIHQAKMLINSISKSSVHSDSSISTQVGLAFQINIKVPYPGKYAEVRLFVPNFENQKTANFAVEISNLGNENIVNAKAYIDILGPLNDKIVTLQSESVLIEPKKSQNVFIGWESTLNPGVYMAKVTVIYDGQNAFDKKTFSVGSPQLLIDAVSVDRFVLGQIAQFDVLVSSDWNKKIEGIYADVRITDADNNVFALSKTLEADIEAGGKQELKAYWDTKNVEEGEYKLDISLNYLNTQVQKVYDIYVGLDDIVTKATGQVIDSTRPEEVMPKSLVILIILIALLVGVNVFLLMTKFRKKRE